jgi:hypothetical protein
VRCGRPRLSRQFRERLSQQPNANSVIGKRELDFPSAPATRAEVDMDHRALPPDDLREVHCGIVTAVACFDRDVPSDDPKVVRFFVR